MIVPHNVTVLRLVVTNTQLGWIHFQENGSILTVSIISSNLQLLPPSLKNLANLTHLKIQQSYIQHLNFDILQWFQRLQTVDLKYNKIHTITSSPNGKQRPKLSVLLLSNNQLKILNLEVLTPLGWFNLIDLSHNELELVVGRFASNSLSRMLFTHNRLKALDFCQWQPMPSMSSISFESNELTVVPNCMGHFPRLSYVSFSSNRLTKINMAAFGTLDNLQTVDLSFNRISLITFREDRYPMRLEELVLRDNNIECSNPPDIPFCPLDIEFYRISPRQHATKLRNVPRTLGNLKNLTKIKIQKSYIQHVNLDFLQAYKHLRTLDLQRNNIHTVTSSPHNTQLYSFLELLLNYNQLKIVNLEIVPPLGWFRFLEISHNPLELIVGRFASNKLVQIHLMYNRLKTLDF
uniref:Uncharacterized protein n=1 Tax=Anopheles dirus TaxID=7168 RepID=A0A182MZF1_9DIPT